MISDPGVSLGSVEGMAEGDVLAGSMVCVVIGVQWEAEEYSDRRENKVEERIKGGATIKKPRGLVGAG